jgi:predicted homoserine dehydrogenase-like protein
MVCQNEILEKTNLRSMGEKIVDNPYRLRELVARKGERLVRAAIIGAGEFGASFVFQAQYVTGLDMRAVINRTVERGVEAFENAGIASEDIRICDSAKAVAQALDGGKYVVASDLSLLDGLGFDVVLEGTGHPEVGARNAETAIRCGMHLIMVSKEVDSVVGAGLSHKARDAGLVYSLVDGDQPSLLIGLLDWARVIGLDVLAIGKSSEYDFVFDPEAETVTSNGKTVQTPGFGALWQVGDRSAIEVAEARAEILKDLPRHAVPDLCEMASVANNTSFKPSGAVFHVPIARPIEIPDLIRPKALGGLLDEPGMIDVVNCLRYPDGSSLAGGEFIIVACHDQKSWDVLAAKGHIVSRDRKCVMLTNPRHLLGVESATTVLSAALLGMPTSSPTPEPKCDLVARATCDLPAGTVLTASGHHHTIEDVAAELRDGGAIGEDDPAPFYLLANRTLVCDVAAGAFITKKAIGDLSDSVLWRLRREQDALFF